MKIIENLKNKVRDTYELMTTPDSELKERARAIVEVVNLSAQYRLDMGIISQEELDRLAQDTSQESLYNNLLYISIKRGKFPTNFQQRYWKSYLLPSKQISV